MAKLSASTLHALDVIAHVGMAKGLENNVAGMNGFSAFYEGKLPPADKAILKKFDELTRSAYKELARLIAEDGHGTPT